MQQLMHPKKVAEHIRSSIYQTTVDSDEEWQNKLNARQPETGRRVLYNRASESTICRVLVHRSVLSAFL